MIRPQPIRRPRSWRRPVARLARWLTGHPTRTPRRISSCYVLRVRSITPPSVTFQ